MTRFPIPSSPPKRILDIDNFNGVDFTSKIPDISRSNNCKNVIKRNGFHQIRKAITQYKSAKEHADVEQIEIGSILSGSEILVYPTNTPRQITREQFKEEFPDFEEGKIVIGNALGAMFIERNNEKQYGLFYKVPTTYGTDEFDALGYDDSTELVTVGNKVLDLSSFTLDQWNEAVTIFDESYFNIIYKTYGENKPERVPKLVDKITGELWEETPKGYHKIAEEHEMYLKISSYTLGEVYHNDYFQVFADASLIKDASKEVYYQTMDFDRDNKILEYYKTVMFNDKPHYFTATGIYTVTAKQIKKMDGSITIEMNLLRLGSHDYPAYTPLYRINCDPEMTHFTQNQDVNLINHFVEIGYLGEENVTKYKLMYNRKDYNSNDEVRVKLLQSDGEWIEYGEHDDIFSFDTTGDYIVFEIAPGKSPVDGVDNIIIKQRYGDLNYKEFFFENSQFFKESSLDNNTAIAYNIHSGNLNREMYIIVDGKILHQNDTVENPYPNGKAWYIEEDVDSYYLYKYRTNNNCPAQTLVTTHNSGSALTEEEYSITHNVKNLIVYGNDTEKRLFINGDKNIEVYSEANDITYWPSSNYITIGDESDIIGFGLSNGYLLTFKKGNNSIFVQQGATVNNKSVFPTVYSQDSNEVISEPIQLDDTLYVFTQDGLQEVSYYNNRLNMINRSYFINKKLKDMNFDTLKWFKWDDNLYFMLKDYYDAGTHIFVADLDDNSRVYEKSSSVGNSFTTGIDYQYEWYYLYTMLPPIYFTDYSWVDDTTKYLLGYNNNGLYSVREDSEYEDKLDQDIFVNGIIPLIIENPINAHWETPFIDMDDITKAKTIRGIYLNTNSKPGDKMVVIAKTIDDGYNTIGETIYNSMMNEDFPRRIYIKDKIRKFMNVKYVFTNTEDYEDARWEKETANFSFNRLSIEYQLAGKYRGE